jgi:hypothetical protein
LSQTFGISEKPRYQNTGERKGEAKKVTCGRRYKKADTPVLGCTRPESRTELVLVAHSSPLAAQPFASSSVTDMRNAGATRDAASSGYPSFPSLQQHYYRFRRQQGLVAGRRDPVLHAVSGGGTCVMAAVHTHVVQLRLGPRSVGDTHVVSSR